MKTSLHLIRQHILDMPAYEPILPFDVLSEELRMPIDQLIKLDANENPYGPLAEVKDALASIDTLHIYPDPETRRIRNILAKHHQISENSIVIGAGADELIDLIVRIVIEPGEVMINCPPTFGMYAFDGTLNRAKLISVPRYSDFSLNLSGIKEAVAVHQPKILFLANPNNPDGSVISEEIFSGLMSLPLLLVMDEAYIQFSDLGSSVLDRVASYDNLVVLRTFSKWAGLAGLRIGYGVFPEALVPMLMKAKQPYNVSVAAERAAVVTMQHLPKSQARISQMIDLRQELFHALTQIPWLKPYPSQANFVLCKVIGFSAKEVSQRLRTKGILIRYFDKPGLDDHIRISVGTREQMDVLIKELKGILTDENGKN